jgi:Ferritin-like domain
MGLPEQVVTDEVMLRTCSSLEHSLVAAYTAILALATIKPETAATVRNFSVHHAAHATYYENLTRDLGGQPFTTSNSAFDTNIVTPALQAMAQANNDPGDVQWFVYGMESVAAGSFQLFVQSLTKPALRANVMTVGAVEARHAAIAAGMISTGTPVPPLPAGQATGAAPSTIPGATTTTTPANQLIAVSQVPGPFGSLSSVSVAIANKEEVWPLLGPNSYEYLPTTSS